MHDLDGRIPLLPEGKTLVSARSYNRMATVLRNIYSESLQIGVAPNGGLRLEIDSQPIGEGGGGGDVLAYAGPFAMSATGVAAGKCLIFGDGADVVVNFTATAYADMYNSQSVTTGVVWLDVYRNASTQNVWTPFYFILPLGTNPGFYANEFFIPVGRFDSTAGTWEQWLTGYPEFFVGGGGYAYAGPFALSLTSANEGTTAVHVEPGCIYAGIAKVTTNQANINIAASTWIALTLTQSNGVYSYSIATSNSPYPEQSSSTYVVTLGWVDADHGSIVQWQHGPIYVAGRAV